MESKSSSKKVYLIISYALSVMPGGFKAGSLRDCINYVRNAIIEGSKLVRHFINEENEITGKTVAYITIIHHAYMHAKRCAELVIMNAKLSGLGKSFEEAYGESMEDYLNGCINGVKDKHGNLNEEDAIHCYLALLTAVEAITE